MLTIESRITRVAVPEAANQELLQLLRDVAGAPADSTATITAAPLPGQHWQEQGGTYAGIMRGDNGEAYHLIVGPDSMDFPGQPWGGTGNDEPGAKSCWDGRANTLALIESSHDHPAAQAIHQINGAGPLLDWYLPAQAELSLCRATVRHLFKTDDWYWSSTQHSANNAWFQGFSSGSQNTAGKYGPGRARAVRRLVIQ